MLTPRHSHALVSDAIAVKPLRAIGHCLPIYSFFSVVILLFSCVLLLLRKSYTIPIQILRYSICLRKQQRLLVRVPFSRCRQTFFTSSRSSKPFIAESTVFLSILHSCAINRLDGKQQFFSLSLWQIRQQQTVNSFGFNPSENIRLGSIKKFLFRIFYLLLWDLRMCVFLFYPSLL